MLEPLAEDEGELIRKSRQGDRRAFGDLVDRHSAGVIRVVYRLCGDAQIAEDSAQEAFIRAWVRLPEYQPRAPFRSWVYRIAINTALDTLRHKTEESIEDGEDMQVMAAKNPGPEAAFIQKEQADAVQKAVGTLPEAARTVLVLREYGGLSYTEISSVLDIPVGTVMSRLNYARSRLREMLPKLFTDMEREYA